MLDVKFVVRNIGTPTPSMDVYSPQEVSEYLKYQYPDYELKETHYLGEVKDQQGNAPGWKVMLILVKRETLTPLSSVLKTESSVVGDKATPKRGKPAKVA